MTDDKKDLILKAKAEQVSGLNKVVGGTLLAHFSESPKLKNHSGFLWAGGAVFSLIGAFQYIKGSFREQEAERNNSASKKNQI